MFSINHLKLCLLPMLYIPFEDITVNVFSLFSYGISLFWFWAVAYQFDEQFRDTLKSLMIKYNSNENELSHIEDSLEESKLRMISDIECILNRGQKLEALISKAEELEEAERRLKRGYCIRKHLKCSFHSCFKKR